jgi:hypothetical protein
MFYAIEAGRRLTTPTRAGWFSEPDGVPSGSWAMASFSAI